MFYDGVPPTKLTPDGFHDHGELKGPCSKERHHLIMFGLKQSDKDKEDGKPAESFFDRLYRYLTSTKDNRCLCCREVLE